MRVVKGRLSVREMAITSCVLILGTLVYFAAFYGPKSKVVAQQREEVKKLAAELALHQSQIARLAPVRTDAKGPTVPLQKYLAMNERFSDLITRLNGDGKVYRVNRLAMEKQEIKASFSKNTFNLEIETSFLKLGQFIEALEKSDFLLEINSVDVLRVDRELRKCTARIQLNSYVARKGL